MCDYLQLGKAGNRSQKARGPDLIGVLASLPRGGGADVL